MGAAQTTARLLNVTGQRGSGSGSGSGGSGSGGSGSGSRTGSYMLFAVNGDGQLVAQAVQGNSLGPMYANVAVPGGVDAVIDITATPAGTLLALFAMNGTTVLFRSSQLLMSGSAGSAGSADAYSTTWTPTVLTGAWSSVSLGNDGNTLFMTSSADKTLWQAALDNLSAGATRMVSVNPPQAGLVKVLQLLDGSLYGIASYPDSQFYSGALASSSSTVSWTLFPNWAGNHAGVSAAQTPSGSTFVVPLSLGGSGGPLWTSSAPGADLSQVTPTTPSFKSIAIWNGSLPGSVVSGSVISGSVMQTSSSSRTSDAISGSVTGSVSQSSSSTSFVHGMTPAMDPGAVAGIAIACVVAAILIIVPTAVIVPRQGRR
jgi:hypothetical protein